MSVKDTTSVIEEFPRPEWDRPAPNAGCQDGHRLIEFVSQAKGEDCPLCATKSHIIELEDLLTRAMPSVDADLQQDIKLALGILPTITE